MTLFLFAYLYYVRKHLSWLLYVLGCLLLFFLWLIVAQEPTMFTSPYLGIVIDRDGYEDTDRVTVQINHKNYHMYIPADTLKVGDKVMIEGEMIRYENATVPEGFDRYMYYRSKNISGRIDLEHYENIGEGIAFYQLRDQLHHFYEKRHLSIYAMNVLFGENLDEESQSIYEQLGITYLLSISGLHLYAMVALIKKILFYFSVSDRIQSFIILCCYAVFCYLHRFELGILRLLIMQGLVLLNDRFSWRKSRFELLQMTFMMMLLSKITLLFSFSILISYLLLTMIHLIKPWFDSFEGYIKRMLYSGFIMVWLLPFFQMFDPILIVLMPILIFFIVYVLTIGAFFTCLAPALSNLLDRYGQVVELGLSWLNKNHISLHFPKFDTPLIILYYGLIIGFFLGISKLKKGWIMIAYVTLLFMGTRIEHQTSRVLFIDVGQGDSTIVETNDCVAVIDSYENTHDYLKTRGITTIHYLFLSHSDIDHIKEAEDILRDFEVLQLIGSKEVTTYPEYQQKMNRARSGDIYRCGNITFDILGPVQSYHEENNASLVMQFDVNQTRFLLTGDIEIEAETNLIEQYGHQLRSDVLKIAHHGSKTSSTSLFLQYVNPKTIIISAGRNNHYGFPHEEVINRLMNFNTILYRTDYQGTIVFEHDRKGEKWYFHLPFSPRFWYNMYRARGRMYG